ncbi:MAG: ABC transporter ATP-binding protein [Rhodocyclaceae bacterium]
MTTHHDAVAANGRPRITPLWQTWRQVLINAGSRAPQLRASLIGLSVAAALQGLALACILPLFVALLNRHDMYSAGSWLIAMSALMLASVIIRWRAQGFDYFGHMTATTHELRTRLGEQLRRIPLESLQDKRAGEVNALLLGNVDEKLGLVLTVANMMATALLAPLVVALATLWFDWRLGLLMLLIFPSLLPLYRWLRPLYGSGMRTLALANRRTSADIFEYVQGLPILRAACSEGDKAVRLQAGFTQLQALQEFAQRKGTKPHLVMTTLIEVSILMTLCAGAGLVVIGTLDVAVLAAALVLAVRFAEPLATLIIYTQVIELTEAALEHIKALLAIEPLPQRLPAQQASDFDIRLDEVSFQYAGAERPTLRTLSAAFPARGLTALVGPSGSGKTTITRLLMRHADPQQGAVFIGGIDIRNMAPEHLNSLISVVFQDVYLFNDSIIANIRMARPDASDAEVEAAARAANCHEFITRLAEGYDTQVGDIGGRLSGGERQRISIARAMLKNAPIVILDEPSAALDTESEVAVQHAIDRLVRDKTVIVIAHRLSTIAAADNILVIDDGIVAEQGRHGALLAAGGRYHAMWQAQQAVKSWHIKR